jgi:regulator of replication initiation timing
MSYYECYREVIDLRGKLYDIEKEALRLMKENTRLREALQSIVDSGPASPGDKKHEIAKAVLVGE